MSHDRSRSWILAEALRRYAASVGDPGLRGAAETTPSTGAEPGLGPSRLAQLHRDLTLTPEARVREAELTLQLTELGAPRTNHVIAFDRYEDFLDWKRARDLRR